MNIPIRYEWSQAEIVSVAEFFDVVASTQEEQIADAAIMNAYSAFKKVVPSKAEEKQLFKEIDEQLGISCYQIVKQAKQGDAKA